ncbi:conserved glutamic acid-rich protein [Aspergillus sp. HF37]|nr:conserved glutamic acid-rich protein [Aspergillus sp. HF37]
MDVPAIDDTMEMASPYQGQVDDFEIDLDVMEDHMSNPDKDMTIADDEPPTSNMDSNHYAANDTDMIDDVAERAMLDADDNDPDTVDRRYGEGEVYEADMAEDNYDEDIDAPVPNDDAEDEPVTLEDANAQVQGEQVQPADKKDLVEESRRESVVEHTVKALEEHTDEHQHDSHGVSERDDHVPEDVPQETQRPQNPPEHVEEGLRELQDTNNTERVDQQPAHTDDGEVGHAHVHHPEHGGAPYEPDDQQVREAEKKKVSESNDQETDTAHRDAPLHPLKVYYQDNEISLFPPREGDSSEMFLLEDENLAYGDFGKLLDSCREVLQESIGENEVLVIDVESLGIQLTEESSHLSQVMLHQILDLYLRLCHNEDIAEPEPLYLTLSTKLTIPAQISDLAASVNEGKGLSDIQQWDDYDETVPVSAEGHEGESDQEFDHVAPAQDTAPDDDSQEALKEAEPSLHVQDTHDELEEPEPEGDRKSAGDEGEGAAPAPHTGEDEYEVYEEGDNVHGLSDHEASYHSPNEGAYESEAQKTESTATITQQLPDEHYDESASVPLDAQAADDLHGENHDADTADGGYDDTEGVAHGENEGTEGITSRDEYHVTEDVGDEDYNDYEEAAEVDVNVPEQHDLDGAHEADEGEANAENANDQADENWSEAAAEDGEEHFAEEAEDEDITAIHDSARQDGSPGAARESPKPTDDVLNISEDANTPVEGIVHANEKASDPSEPGEIRSVAEDASQAIPELDEDWAFDDGEHIDLGTDTLEANKTEPSRTDSHVPENAATKRNREPEGEGEVGDTKRRRSS